LANGPFSLNALPVSGSTIGIGTGLSFGNYIRISGSIISRKIDVKFSIAECTKSNNVETCKAATEDVPIASGLFDFASFCLL
jgi:hypothetical protein